MSCPNSNRPIFGLKEFQGLNEKQSNYHRVYFKKCPIIPLFYIHRKLFNFLTVYNLEKKNLFPPFYHRHLLQNVAFSILKISFLAYVVHEQIHFCKT
jgi:hypothetical protein